MTDEDEASKGKKEHRHGLRASHRDARRKPRPSSHYKPRGQARRSRRSRRRSCTDGFSYDLRGEKAIAAAESMQTIRRPSTM
jgi:hypothetical protein